VTLSGTGAVAELFYDDLVPGTVFDLGVTVVDEDEMLAFARRFDPQWYHVDEALAAESAYGAPIASGFFTASLFMGAAAAASPGLEELRWTAPVYGGDHLASRLAAIDRAPSRAQPGFGTVTLAGAMIRLGPDGEPEGDVLKIRFRGWFALRPGGNPPVGQNAGI
jgi:acyl dehydratase